MVDYSSDLLNEAFMDFSMVEVLTAHSAPARLPCENDARLEQRNWAIRLISEIREGWSVGDASVQLSHTALKAVHEARLERSLTVNEESQILPRVRVLPVDSRHIIVTIITIRLEEDDAHAWLVAAGAVLRSLNQLLPIDDIQGIPWRFWRLVVGDRQTPP